MNWITKTKQIVNFSIILIVNVFFISSKIYAENINENVVKFGIMNYFFSDVNINDAKVAMKNWANQLNLEYKKKTGKLLSISIFYYDDINEMIKSLKLKQIDIVILSSYDYIIYDLKKYTDPFMIDKPDNRSEKILIVSKKSNIKNFSDLKSKKISLDIGIDGIFSRYWFNMICQQNDVNDYHTYFSLIELNKNNNMNIMSLFFGKSDACITSQFTLNTNSELNPQFKNKFEILMRSEAIPYSVTCIRKDCKYVDIDVLTDIAANTINNSTMKSMMELFKRSSVVKFNEKMLDPVFKLIQFNKKNSEKSKEKKSKK